MNSLAWAIGWIEKCREIPLKDVEPEDHAAFLAAKADSLDWGETLAEARTALKENEKTKEEE